MFMVIFGAGASYDSLASALPNGVSHGAKFSRPPLAKQLFWTDRYFAQWLDYFPECHPVIPYLQGADNLEHTLEALQEEARTDSQRLRQITATRFYLQLMIENCGNDWKSETRGITNYVTLLDQLRRHRKPGDPVLLVTFNYDKMIEDALPSVGVAVDELSHYISDDAFKLFKLHGSVNWAHEVETEIPNLPERNPWDVAKELIHRVADLQISNRYRMVVGQPISKVEDIPLFPAIAIPVENKSGFKCPSDHVDCLRAHLEMVTKILIVGWRATERHFLDLLRGAVTDKIPVQVVAGGRGPGEEVLSHFAAAGISVLGEALDAGFSHYVLNRTAEQFFEM